MVTIEQVRLLETKVAKAVEYVQKITEENKLLSGKLNDYQKRIEELEALIERFKEDQAHIEEGILSALDRLNQFEAAVDAVSPGTVSADAQDAAPVEEAPAASEPADDAVASEPAAAEPAPEAEAESAPEPEPAAEPEPASATAIAPDDDLERIGTDSSADAPASTDDLGIF
jgi:chromosome segregation ATPase